MVLQQNLSKEDFYKKYYKVLNGLLNMTNTEINILSEFSTIRSNLPDTFSEEDKDKYTFSSVSRQLVCDTLKVSKFNLNNYIKVLKSKRVILSRGKDYYINPQLFVDITKTNLAEITFKFKLI